MKKIIFSLTMAAVLFAGCAKEIDAPQAGDFKTITIQAEIPQTKVGIDNNGKSSWQAGDKIGIQTQNGAIAEFTYQENNTFKGQIAADDELSEMAIYPINIATSYNEEKELFNVNMPGKYTYVEGNSFAPHLGTKNDNGVYAFKPYSALFKFTITNVPSDARGFKFLCGAGKKICGDALAVQFYQGNKYIETKTDNLTLASKTIDISFTAAQIPDTKTMTFYVPVPVSGDGYYFNVALTDVNGDVIPSTARVLTQASSKVSMPYGTVKTYNFDAMPKTYTSPVEWKIGAGGQNGTSWRAKRNTFFELWPRTGGTYPGTSTKYTNRDTDFHIWPIAAGESARMQFFASELHTNITLISYEFQEHNMNYNSPAVKSFFTDDYFEFCIPVKNFSANTEVTFAAPIYSRGAPIFWNIEYFDGGEWKCNKTMKESLDVIAGTTVKAQAECTWVLPHGATNGNFEGVYMEHKMTFENAIENGHLRIRMKAVGSSDGIYITFQHATTFNNNKAYLKTTPQDAIQNSMVTFCNLSDTYKSVKISW